MKVVYSITKLYKEQLHLYQKLGEAVDKLIFSIKGKGWHYDSRIKSLESYALKLEACRQTDPTKMEDFFACTLVVENTNEIKNVINLLKPYFKIQYRKPPNEKFTHKNSDSFVFDDLRLYTILKASSARLKGPLNEILFEIQIKTFLQHAWSIATHDLIYKSDEINWSKQRVAYQVKAMLENAEISIEKASNLKKISGIPLTNEKVEAQKRVKKFILANWSNDKLPKDLIRLVDNIIKLLKYLNLDLGTLEIGLADETKQGRGNLTLNLSPYLVILQTLINQEPAKVNGHIRKDNNKKILIPQEIDISKIIENIDGANVIRI
jgi:ppGpp synthetase/RelA/SpoT-type nucleotidyltranferase